ncbi:CGNR zinc finger domain-containing protein [Streptomyces uncialis]|uniref:CGNR zinc finger domain-containing protein n=1 Tax=Streptomyces uncialis TaxID=1048205 RepID=UPI003809D918
MLEAPPSAQLVEAFVNTVDVELGTDDLAVPDQLPAWLAERGLLPSGTPVTTEEHQLALRLRDGIRENLGVHTGDTPDPGLLRDADEVLRRLPLVATLRPGSRATLEPAPGLTPVRHALAALAVAWTELTVTGEAARLKRCAEHTCAWVFWDSSKNRSRRWCSMRVCGNRTKARRYATKRTSVPGTVG